MTVLSDQNSDQQTLNDLLEVLLIRAVGQMERTQDVVELHPENQTPISPATSLNEAWLCFLQEATLVEHLHSALAEVESPAALTIIPNLFLPSLLYVKLVSIFDEALQTYIDGQGWSVPKKFGSRLDGRLLFLNSIGKLSYRKIAGDHLYDIKENRNRLAHLPTTPANWEEQQISWQDLHAAIDKVETVLQNLSLIGPRPVYEPFVERRNEDVPTEKPHVRMTHTYSYGFRERGKDIVRFTHSWDYYRINQ